MTRINFMGDKTAHTPLERIQSFVTRPEIMTGTALLVIGFCMAGLEHVMPPAAALTETIAETTAVTAVMGRIFERQFMLRKFFSKQAIRDLCINKNPKYEQPHFLNSSDHVAARQMRDFSWIVMIADAAGLGCHIPRDLPAQAPASLLAEIVIFSVLMARMGAAAFRWSKVTKGEWVIEDKEQPQKMPQRHLVLKSHLSGPAFEG